MTRNVVTCNAFGKLSRGQANRGRQSRLEIIVEASLLEQPVMGLRKPPLAGRAFQRLRGRQSSRMKAFNRKMPKCQEQATKYQTYRARVSAASPSRTVRNRDIEDLNDSIIAAGAVLEPSVRDSAIESGWVGIGTARPSVLFGKTRRQFAARSTPQVTKMTTVVAKSTIHRFRRE